MSKRFIIINGSDFLYMVSMGAQQLHANVDRVNALNVFPVPDGDTGTNMNLTMSFGFEELKKRQNNHLGQAAEIFSKGLLMGARGNSGVILSQLFRGFAKSVQGHEQINVQQFAAAFQSGVDTAYKAVIKPVEGTILTVAREAAQYGLSRARNAKDLNEWMQDVLEHAKRALAKTPDLLPILKQVGVVDAGGQGLICIYEGFVAALSGQRTDIVPETVVQPNAVAPQSNYEPKSAQAKLATEDIEFGYCTEFILKLNPSSQAGASFNEALFRNTLMGYGDSLVVVADDDLVKVHVHAEYPGDVMNHAMKFGELTRIKIENMREQHSHIVTSEIPQGTSGQNSAREEKLYGFVAVSIGEGLSNIFSSLGVDVVLSGGQTMNPSTEDLVNAVQQTGAQTVFILPNNSNIILAAQQAKELLAERQIIVIPTKTIPQGLAAMIAFETKAGVDANTEAMTQAIAGVQSGQVTRAVRDSGLNGLSIQEGDFLGIVNNQLVVAEPDCMETCRQLLDRMMADGGEIVTIFTGEGATSEQTKLLKTYLEQTYPDAELEVHSGGQPLYPYLFSVE